MNSWHQNIIIIGQSELKPINKTITELDSADRYVLRENKKLGEMKCFCVMTEFLHLYLSKGLMLMVFR